MGSGANSTHLRRRRHRNLSLRRPSRATPLLASVSRSVKGTDAQGTASAAPRRPESTWVRAPPEGPRGLPTRHRRNQGWGGVAVGPQALRVRSRPCAHVFLRPSPRVSRTSWKSRPTAALQPPTPRWPNALQRSDSRGGRKFDPRQPSQVQCAMRPHAQSLLGRVVPG